MVYTSVLENVVVFFHGAKSHIVVFPLLVAHEVVVITSRVEQINIKLYTWYGADESVTFSPVWYKVWWCFLQAWHTYQYHLSSAVFKTDKNAISSWNDADCRSIYLR